MSQLTRAPAGFEGDAALLSAMAMLADGLAFGAIWADRSQIVLRKYGAIADLVDVGSPLSDGLFPLLGQEDRIAALATSSAGAPLVLPNLSVQGTGGPIDRIRFNVSVYWRPESQTYLVLLGRVLSSHMYEQALEAEIRQRRIADAELARINRQLEEFAYVISHDLKAPLRALRYHSDDILDATLADQPDVAALRVSAAEIMAHSRRMSNMLSGLLEYSSIGRIDAEVVAVDTEQLVSEIAGSIRVPDGFQIAAVGPFPTILTTPAPLDLTLRNLIDNAVKHHDRPNGRVQVSAEDESASVVFLVADDGRGIPKEWQRAIFEPFKRIDEAHHPDSSGIGLALVKRTVEAEGGRIEVVSDPDVRRGTTFRIVWPKRLPAKPAA